jgi:hypothetical protein
MQSEDRPSAEKDSAAWGTVLAKLLAIALLVVLVNLGASWLVDRVEVQVWPEHMEIVDRTVLIAVIVYVVLMSTPFLPGIEVGLVLMTMLGPKGVFVVYVCTLIALTISFSVGKFLPLRVLGSFLIWLNLRRTAELMEALDVIPPDRRINFLVDNLPTRIVPLLLKNRFLALAVLLNMPGNALIGGGGSIAMMAGMSRIYSMPKFLLLIIFAILPGPILICRSI